MDMFPAFPKKSLCMVATGEKMVREKILPGWGKVRKFHFESRKILVFERSQGKAKF